MRGVPWYRHSFNYWGEDLEIDGEERHGPLAETDGAGVRVE